VFVVVAIVKVDDPEPLIVAGVKPWLVTPVGRPPLLRLNVTGPVKPL
jgi:hypothetical protein